MRTAMTLAAHCSAGWLASVFVTLLMVRAIRGHGDRYTYLTAASGMGRHAKRSNQQKAQQDATEKASHVCLP
ncbi:hypothetical protein FBQ73_00190 [Xanthobacter autotrophicus]|uniref:Uncharacterized protein n=2 Tax=Xanthobacter autotrophicus TaxID=280 RepID=A0A6C1KKP1_XANAU|nr:hypothetical protein FBQ73_00190 [Xanthobacter autotrophicus]